MNPANLLTCLLALAVLAPTAAAHDPSGETVGGCGPNGVEWGDVGLYVYAAWTCFESVSGPVCLFGSSADGSRGACVHSESKEAWVCTATMESGSARVDHCEPAAVNDAVQFLRDYPYPAPIGCSPVDGICIEA